MPLNWMDVSSVPFHALLLLEQVQLSWLPGWGIDDDLAVAVAANPVVEWYLRHKCPSLNPWLDRLLAAPRPTPTPEQARAAEIAVLSALNDLVVYALDPAVYDAQPFLAWDAAELTALVDFRGQTVIDVGAGTGRLTLLAAPTAAVVFAVEPVGNLRAYLKQKARAYGHRNVYCVDGLITDLPFPDGFADVVMGGHVYGDDPAAERAELERVVRLGGMVALCPGNVDRDNEAHAYLVSQGYQWSRFEEPRDGWKRKYWKRLPCAS